VPKVIILILISFILTGCRTLEHLDELLTLKDYSESKDATDSYVKNQDAKFEELLKAVNDGTIDKYKTKKTFKIAFGEAVFEREIEKDGKALNECLYRYSTKYFESDKVYVYFDEKGMLIEWKLVKKEENSSSDALLQEK